MENLTTIVKETTAKLTHVCSGKVYYQIDTENLTIQRFAAIPSWAIKRTKFQ